MSYFKKIRLKSNTDSEVSVFYEKNKIDPEDMHYLGKGEFGSAYDVGNSRVLKITSSKSEYNFAREIQKGNFSSFAKVFDAAEIDREYYLVIEKLKVSAKIEDMFYRVQSMLETQSLPVQYISYFDEDDYLEAHSDEADDAGKISKDVLDFMDELNEIVRCYRRLGIENSDIQPDNLGRDRAGKLKAFDIDERR